MKLVTILLTVSILCIVKELQCARILAIVPTPSYSHQIPFRPLCLELNKRGHDVVYVTPIPIPNLNLTNFVQIDVSGLYLDFKMIDMLRNRFDQVPWLQFMEDTLYKFSYSVVERVLNNTEMRKLYAPDSNATFDVVLIEMLHMPALCAFAHRFNAPLIGVISLGISTFNEHCFGGLVLPSHESNWEMETNTGSDLPFWKRVKNFVTMWRNVYVTYRNVVSDQQKLAERYFDMPLPPLLEMQKNISLVFVNQADAMMPARPKLANVITFTSLHVSPNPQPLPQDLKHFVDGASKGFIYFSLGSNLNSSNLPRETLQVFFDVFAKLPYKIVWKFEKQLPEKLNNVYTGSWYSQQSILAHPNIKLFMYQGGLQSSEEAVHFAVPVLGFPVMGDQAYQAHRMEALGVGKCLDITSVTRDGLDSAIREIIDNKKYKQTMIELKNTVNDNPYNLEDNLIWWTEYVIRHKGAPHLRSSLARQPWYQRFDMDIVVFLTIVTLITILITLRFIVKFTVRLRKKLQLQTHDKRKNRIVDSQPAVVTVRPRSTIMKFTVAAILSIVCVLCVVKHLQCARILVIVPTPSYSHQIPYRPLWLELHKRGHEIVLVTTNPIPNLNLTNFRQIDIGLSYNIIKKFNPFENRFNRVTWTSFMENYISGIANDFVEQVFNNTDMKKLYAPDSDAKFDLLMIETLHMIALNVFAHRFNTPIIGFTSLGLTTFNEHALGGLVLPSHEYTWEMEANTGPNLPFWKRLHNFVTLWSNLYVTYRDTVPTQQKIAEKYFGTPLPSLLDIQKNISLIFVNQADVLAPARPKLANMITFTSSHVSENLEALPQNLKRFVDNSTEGFIYFSLGTNSMSSNLPRETLRVFVDVFAKLPYKVVWKFEKELAGKPDNVFTGSWFPQRSILAHPNIKLFIYQGGLQSTEETVHFAVPVLGFPVIADQDYQTGRMDTLGVGKRLELTTVTRDQLEGAIREIATNKEYKERMIELKNAVNDKPYDSVEYLAWWTEYVIRHKGAPHFRSNLAKQPWYQRCDMDVVVFLTIVTFMVVSSALSLSIKFIVHYHVKWQVLPENQKMKIS
ncbi:uncharacterized protein LOC143152578 [Ptiloglossa arizonensis]|uniref:uncharacterized protein LOC143152578 n=1 Tax=Ptiloglossa arizonensis TaxID=3350558 RepID=UPI003FA07F4D